MPASMLAGYSVRGPPDTGCQELFSRRRGLKDLAVACAPSSVCRDQMPWCQSYLVLRARNCWVQQTPAEGGPQPDWSAASKPAGATVMKQTKVSALLALTFVAYHLGLLVDRRACEGAVASRKLTRSSSGYGGLHQLECSITTVFRTTCTIKPILIAVRCQQSERTTDARNRC